MGSGTRATHNGPGRRLLSRAAGRAGLVPRHLTAATRGPAGAAAGTTGIAEERRFPPVRWLSPDADRTWCHAVTKPPVPPLAGRRADAGTVKLTGRDITGLMLCAEHYAPRTICSPPPWTCEPTGCAGSWPAGGTPGTPNRHPRSRPRLVLGDPGRDEGHRPEPTPRPTRAGPARPHPRGARRAAVAPGRRGLHQRRAWWRSERRIRAAIGGRVGVAHIPDAEVHWPSLEGSPYAGQVWAIEAELTPKPLARTVAIMRACWPGPATTAPTRHRARAALRAGGLPDRPGRPARRDPRHRRAARAASAPDRGPRPARRGRLVSIWSWLKLTAMLWLIRKGFKVFGWLLVAAAAIAAWPLTAVAALGYLTAWLRGWPPARLWRAAAWALPMTAAYAIGEALRLRAWQAVALAPVNDWANAWGPAGRARHPPRWAPGRPGRGPGRAGRRRRCCGRGGSTPSPPAWPGRPPPPRSPLSPAMAAPGPRRTRPGRRARRRPAADPARPGGDRRDHPHHPAPVAARPDRPATARSPGIR